MAAAPDRLSRSESDRIYQEEIRPLHLGGVDRSTLPTVVFVGGSPGSGKTALVPTVAAKLAARSGVAAVVSVDELREHHPGWAREARRDGQAAERFSHDASRWVDKLYAGAIAEGKNVVFETGFKTPQLLSDTVAKFRAAGYRVEAVILAVDADRTKRAVMGRFLDAQANGQPPRLVTSARHDEGYSGLRTTLQYAEDHKLLDQVQIVTRDGQERFRNTLLNDKWQREPAAVAALDKERDRVLTPTELANNAIAWHQLSARAQLNRSTPTNVVEQALTWRKEASTRALADPEAAKQYHWNLAGESFRTMPREQFLREFPTYAGAVERLDKATRHASQHYSNAQDRDLFINQTQERLSTQIEAGRQFGRIKVSDEIQQASSAKVTHGLTR